MKPIFLNSVRSLKKKNENNLVINFERKKVIKNFDGIPCFVDKIEVVGLVDNPVNKFVVAIVNQPINEILLWKEDSYDAIGNWTNEDVIARINEIYK